MEYLRSFYQERILLDPKSSTGGYENTASRWRSDDLDPVSKSDKKWEWYHELRDPLSPQHP
ncbi:MAG: hypothetical protein L6R40_005668 [Gallowayella cf. fulva]|nr:MAG: hypothetical protein L6R40_005668 [Xanthomendoza cf. fulva]